MVSRALLGLAVGAVALVSLPQEPSAKIKCKGAYQVINGNLHATPWCEDNYLAAVARQYGMRVSNRQIRQDPFAKERACRLAGHDNRVRDICAGELGRNGNRRFP